MNETYLFWYGPAKPVSRSGIYGGCVELQMQNLLEQMPEFKEMLKAFTRGQSPVLLSGGRGAFKALLSAALFTGLEVRGALLVVVPSPEQAGAWQADLEAFLPGREVLVFDPAEVLPFEVIAASREPAAGRLRVLAALSARKKPPVVIAPAEALMPKLLPSFIWEQAALSLKVGAEYDLASLPGSLVSAGYERVDLTEGLGQFALRGNILDIYPFQGAPVRLEFWGDELVSLKELDPESQRSRLSLSEVTIWPAREFIYNRACAGAAEARIKEAYKARRERLKGSKSVLMRLDQRFYRFLEMAAEGWGSLNLVQPYFYPEQVSLFGYLPPGSLIVVDEPGRVQDECNARAALLESDYRRFFQEGSSFTPWQEYYFRGEELFQDCAGFPVLAFSQILSRPGPLKPQAVFNVTVKEMQPFFSRPDLLVPEVREWLRRRTAVLLLAQTEARLRQLERDLRDHEFAPLVEPDWPGRLEEGRLIVGIGNLSRGFELPGRLAVVTARELYGRRTGMRGRTRLAGKGASILPELAAGDYVVHPHHGIGRYLGIKKMEVEGRIKDYLEVVYAGEDRLYLPVEQAALIQKYTGPEGRPPRLSRLGGADWTRLKQKVKKGVRKLAQDLLVLYARRMAARGYAFSPDTVWQQEFEATFPYEETPDQRRVILEVKADMEKPRPMDRLVCGDVGFGKTEVGVRAAFKAVQDGKQVAVLVPTTVLAQQHYYTFKERFGRYPLRVEMLTRFRSPREQKAIVRDLERGLIDVIIGTHRLLSGDVVFKDLGLLIVDEEQRFGVSHKEKIKMLRTSLDVLTLTATPIPRTLQMSLTGVRDLSTIETPPEDRLPVQTYVLEYAPEVVRDAIRREIQRGGQVFYLHNRIQTIEKCAAFLQGLVPEASFRIAHGRMKEDELEEVMWDFLNRKFDCLICTTIIENGLDLPNVNTLIVEQAGQFGLAQLYQLRGRVGRSDRLAYAYFTFARDKVLTEQAEKRLRALQEFTEFGSGFKLALRDLEIRGAGNLLGPEQHGHMAAVGFDLYHQMLEEAVRELKGEEAPESGAPVPVWEIYADSHLPDSYVGDARQKIEIYRRLALADDLKTVEELAEEVRDRFGPFPEPAVYLFDLARLRIRARELMIREVRLMDHTLVVRFGSGAAPKGAELTRWSAVFGDRISFSAVGELEVRIKTKGLSSRRLLGMLTRVLLPQPVSVPGRGEMIGDLRQRRKMGEFI